MSAAATYLALADLLERRIDLLVAGQRLPSEHELAAEHDVHRQTARAALQELERRHRVRRVQGLGTFVAQRIEYRIGSDSLPSLTETVAAAGAVARQRNLRVRSVRLPADVRADLELGAHDRGMAIDRLTIVDDEVVGCSRSWLRAALVPHLAGTLPDEGSLYGVLRARYGLDPVRERSRVELEVPPRDIAATLGLDGRPLTWSLTSVNRSRRGGELLEVSHGWLRADLFRVVLEVGGP